MPMASSSPNTSGRAGKMLSELLKQPQDPFLLEFYLLENGCSGRIVSSQGSRFCWPSSKRLRNLGNHQGIRSGRAAALLTCVLLRLSYSKVIIKKALRWTSILNCFFSKVSNNRLSPVSVVEPHNSDESSSIDYQCKSIFPEFHSTFECHVQQHSPFKDELRSRSSGRVTIKETLEKFSDRRMLVFDCLREAEDRIWNFHGFVDTNMFEVATDDLILSWESQKVNLNTLPEMVSSEITDSNEEWNHFKPEVREIALCLEASIFADLKEEAFL